MSLFKTKKLAAAYVIDAVIEGRELTPEEVEAIESYKVNIKEVSGYVKQLLSDADSE